MDPTSLRNLPSATTRATRLTMWLCPAVALLLLVANLVLVWSSLWLPRCLPTYSLYVVVVVADYLTIRYLTAHH